MIWFFSPFPKWSCCAVVRVTFSATLCRRWTRTRVGRPLPTFWTAWWARAPGQQQLRRPMVVVVPATKVRNLSRTTTAWPSRRCASRERGGRSAANTATWTTDRTSWEPDPDRRPKRWHGLGSVRRHCGNRLATTRKHTLAFAFPRIGPFLETKMLLLYNKRLKALCDVSEI